VDILQVGGTEEYFYYVMELADDLNEECRMGSAESSGPGLEPKALSYVPRTLRSELKGRGRLPPAECVSIGLAICSALGHLHRRGLVHRDVKPSNIIFVEGVPKLADIGLVAETSEARSFVGTEGFIPPEGPGSPQADLYSLGKALYEISTGHNRRDFPALPRDVAAQEPGGSDADLNSKSKIENSKSEIDEAAFLELNVVVVKACKTDLRGRYQGAEEMQADLELLQQGRSVKLKRAAERKWSLVKRFGLPGAVLVVVAALLFTSASKRGKGPNPEAVRLYKLGRWHVAQVTDDSLRKAEDFLNQAIEKDPTYAAPYITLFELNAWKVRDEEQIKSNKAIASRLMAINPKLAEAHAALSWVSYCDGDWQGALQQISEAEKLDPNYIYGHGFHCYYLSLLGRVPEAKGKARLGQLQDPTSRILATIGGFPFVAAREYDQAIAQFRKAIDLDPGFARAHTWLGKALEAKGQYSAAIDEFEKSDLLSGEEEAKARAEAHALREALKVGSTGYWQKALELEQAAEAEPMRMNLSRTARWSVPGIYAKLGDKKKALELLEEDGRNDFLKLDPLYESLREEPRFKDLLKKNGLEN
jgi:serine/threonine protein kinase